MKLLTLIHTYNYIDLIIPCLILLVSTLISPLFFFIGLHLFLFIVWSLRQKNRYHKQDSRNYLSPVDGIVTEIKHEATFNDLEGIWKCVQISTHITDSHIQYSPIGGSIISTQQIENEILSPYFDWMDSRISGVLRVILSGFMQEGTIITEINNIANQSHCIVQTSVECRLKWIDIVNYIFTKFSLASHTKCVGALRRIMGSREIDEGSAMAVLGLGGVFGKMITRVYVPIDVELKVQVGQTMIAAETVIAQSPVKTPYTANGNNTENLMTFQSNPPVSTDNFQVIG